MSKFYSTGQLPECKLHFRVLEESGGLKCPILPRNSMCKNVTGINSNSSLQMCRDSGGSFTKHLQTHHPVRAAGRRSWVDAADGETENKKVSGFLEVPQLTARKQAGLTPHLALLCVWLEVASESPFLTDTEKSISEVVRGSDSF